MTQTKIRVSGSWHTVLGGATYINNLWYGWDPNSLTSPPDITSFYVGASSTGLPPGTGSLTVHVGDYTTSGDGEVIDMMELQGDVFVQHDNVIIKRCRILGRVSGHTGLKIWACDWGRTNPGDTLKNGFRYDQTEIRRCNIYGFTDSMQFNGTGMRVRDNFFHDCAVANDGAQDSGISHNDHIQIIGGSDHEIVHNTFYGWSFDGRIAQTCTNSSGPNWGNATRSGLYSDGYQTSNIMINSAGIDDVLIEDNLFYGHPSKHIINQSGNTNIVIQNNRLGRDYRDYPTPFSISGATLSGNVYDDNEDPAP